MWGNKKKYVEEQIDRARKTSRDEVLAEKPRKENTQVSFVVHGLPSWSPAYWRSTSKATSSFTFIHEVQVPMMAYRKPKSLAQYQVRARFTNTPKEKIDGT